MRRIPDGVRAIFFDAVGTLVHPEPSAADAYFAAGRRHGSRLDRDEVRRRFSVAFRAEERRDAAEGHRTDEARERQRWRAIVAAVLDDVADADACFAELYDHFALPRSWRRDPAAGGVLAALHAAGYVVGVASNFDHRLRAVVSGLGPLDHLAISSEVGWKKPAPEFFAALSAMTGARPAEILVVGDDEGNDYDGPKAAGLHALLLSPGGPAGTGRLASLGELLD